MHIDGGCHCGRIRYRAQIDPARVSICHCTHCQTLTGSPFRVTALSSRDAIDLTGQPATYAKTGDSGRGRLMYFCRDCGTPLFSSSADGSGDWGIRWGSITQRAELRPTRQVWCRSAMPWLDEIADLPAKATD